MKVVKKMEFPLYGGNFWVVVSNDFKEANAVLKSETFSEDDFYAHTCYRGVMNKALGYEVRTTVLVFNIAHPQGVSSGTMAHEAVHAANTVMEYAGWKHDSSNDEPYAYLVGWIVDEVQKCIDEYKKKYGA